MHFLKKYQKIVKFTCLATFSLGAGWLYYQVKTTKKILSNALDTSILSIVEPTAIEKAKDDDFFVIDITGDPNRQETSYLQKWNALKFSFAKRLLVLASSDNRFLRKRAVRQLARIKKLETWQYSQLADMIDARTAVGLARTPGVEPRLFNNPPLRFLGHTHDMIVDVMKNLLVNLHATSQHPCMGYFISKAFVDLHEVEKFGGDDITPYELKNFIQTSEELLPTCLESLLHHASLGKYAKDIAELNGLPLLMEIHNRFKDNITVTATICRIISYLSMHKDLLDEMYKSGWVGLLAQWVKHDDVRISIPASKALANLDSDEDPVYLQRLYPLHPSTRIVQTPGVDVVFVHGLLGGVFFTWRQRKRNQDPLGFLGKKGVPESLTQKNSTCINKQCTEKKKKIETSDPVMREFMEEFETHAASGCLCNDYDFVWEDIPVNTNETALGPYCCSGYKYVCMENNEDDCYTNCWPRDWLAQDCDRLRIIGVNYETNLSLWTPICPVEKVKTLEERSDELIEQLERVEVGRRPIVWVTHSMGGLMVKCLLNKASESSDKKIRDLYTNTRGLVFYSTPHFGSSVASFSQASALVIWPSIEVQELQKNSPLLIQIHQKFLKLTENHPMKIVTFVETKPTVVSAMKFKFFVVEPDSGNPGYGEYYEIPLDHLGICKPASRHSFLYQKVLHMITSILDNNGPV
ncbi:protein SERAC1 isoform X1 [Tribolium madens]|uniref:protein SERAC1 isoform X1 n=1 Tax=Tribolium madens TaxID=41895 RepID=UPI001CF730D8|nr:protein SERAC1 isoform X1 [Tribolium madens]